MDQFSSLADADYLNPPLGPETPGYLGRAGERESLGERVTYPLFLFIPLSLGSVIDTQAARQ